MKLYVCSSSENMMDSVDGVYYLITEEGECLATHLCSSKWFAKGDLYERRPERIEEFTKRFGECECLYLGEDDMTAEKILELNKKYFEKHPEKFDKQSLNEGFIWKIERRIR